MVFHSIVEAYTNSIKGNKHFTGKLLNKLARKEVQELLLNPFSISIGSGTWVHLYVEICFHERFSFKLTIEEEKILKISLQVEKKKHVGRITHYRISGRKRKIYMLY